MKKPPPPNIPGGLDEEHRPRQATTQLVREPTEAETT